MLRVVKDFHNLHIMGLLELGWESRGKLDGAKWGATPHTVTLWGVVKNSILKFDPLSLLYIAALSQPVA